MVDYPIVKSLNEADILRIVECEYGRTFVLCGGKSAGYVPLDASEMLAFAEEIRTLVLRAEQEQK